MWKPFISGIPLTDFAMSKIESIEGYFPLFRMKCNHPQCRISAYWKHPNSTSTISDWMPQTLSSNCKCSITFPIQWSLWIAHIVVCVCVLWAVHCGNSQTNSQWGDCLNPSDHKIETTYAHLQSNINIINPYLSQSTEEWLEFFDVVNTCSLLNAECWK